MAIGLGVYLLKKVGLVWFLDDPIPPDYEQIMITGNAALSSRATSAGLDRCYF